MKTKRGRYFTITVVTVATAATLYALEAVASVAPSSWLDRLGTSLRRGPSVIAETQRLRNLGIDALPFLQSDLFTHSPDSGLALSDQTTIAPLAGIPEVLTVLCNESGTTIAYRADLFGFRNADTAWQRPLVALVGDSFTHGFCRTERETIAGQLRERGVEVVNAGVTGAGPLTELGIIREYLAPAQPRVVYWLFYEGNDLIDLTSEIKTITARYRDPGFSQDLPNRNEIGAAMAGYGDSLLAAYGPRRAIDRVRGFLTLRSLRVATGLSGTIRPTGVLEEDRELELLEEVLNSAKAEVESWNGELRIVYLPERRRFNKSAPVVGENHDFNAVHSAVVSTANNLLLPLIDITSIFAGQRDPAGMWDNRRYHYNAAGYRLVADAIDADLKASGLSPGATSSTTTRAVR